VLSPADVATERFPRAVIDGLGNSYYKEDERHALEGQKLLVEMKASQVFQSYCFQRRGPRQPLRIGSGFRALTITVNPTTGVAGMLRPGDSVDVVASEELPVAVALPAQVMARSRFTRTLLRKVTVLAVDASTDPDVAFSDYTTVTLQLRPSDVNRLCHVIDQGYPFHLTKLEDTEPASSDADLVWPEKAYHELEAEVRKREEDWAKARIQK